MYSLSIYKNWIPKYQTVSDSEYCYTGDFLRYAYLFQIRIEITPLTPFQSRLMWSASKPFLTFHTMEIDTYF